MDFLSSQTYTEEQERFRQEVRAWLEENVPEEMKNPGNVRDYTEEIEMFRREKMSEIAKKGWLYPTHPKEYGGGGLTPDHATIINEELERARFGRPFSSNLFAMEALLVWATEEQKQKFLVPMLKGEAICYQNLTEPQAGTDLANVKNTAVRDGDDWILNGTNVFIGGPFQPQMIFGPYLTDSEAPRHRNLGYFVVTAPTPGLVLNEMNLVSDERKQAVFLDNVRVPADHLIGGDHQGWQVLATHLEIEHGGRGQARLRDPLVEDLVEFTKEKKHYGESLLGSDPVVQQTAMEAYIESHVHNLLGLRTSWMYQNRIQIQTEGNVHNVHGRLSGLRNALRVRDVMGMYAFVDDRDPRAHQSGRQEIRQRAAVGQRHGQGSTNIAKLILARRMGISRTQERAAPTAASSTSDS